MKKLLPAVLLLCSLCGFGQSGQLFSYKATTTPSGILSVFSNKKNAFSIQINGKSVKPAKTQGPPAPNQHFFDVDGYTVQLSIVPTPQLPPSYHVGNLAIDQQKELLSGYVNYEMDALKDDKVKYTDLKQGFTSVNSRPFIIWTFNYPVKGGDPVQQIYSAVVCYDQVLAISVPVLDKTIHADKAYKLINDIAATLKVYKLP